MAINETATTKVIIDGQEAQAELNMLEREAGELRKKLSDAFKANDYQTVKRLKTELKGTQREMRDLKKATFDTDKVLKNLSGATFNDLLRTKRKLNREIRQMTRGTKEYRVAAKQLRGVEAELNKVTAQMGRAKSAALTLRSAFSFLAPAALIGAAVAGIGRLFRQLPDLAMQMEGDNRRAAIVFGDSLSYVEGEADKLAKKMGVTNREFVAMSAATGDLLIPLDFTRQQAAEMSVELQGLSGALSEWTGGKLKTAEVSEILTKAMLGENEQLKQLGIAIRKDTDEFRDLRDELIRTEGYTKMQAEAMATLELITKKSTDAQTAFNEEGNKLLRWTREVGRQLRQAKEDFVNLFNENEIDKIRDEREEMNNLADYISKTAEGTRERREAVEVFNTKYGKYLDNLLTEKSTIEDIRDAQNQANTALVKNIALKEQEDIRSDYLENQQKQIRFLLKGVERSAPGTSEVVSERLSGDLEQYFQIAQEERMDFILEIAEKYGVGGAFVQSIFENLRRNNESMLKELSEDAQVNAAILGIDPSELNFFGPGGEKKKKEGGGSGGGTGGGGTDPPDYDIMLKEADSYYQERLLKLKKYLQEKRINEEKYNIMSLEEEITYMQTKKEILQMQGEETFALEAKIIDKQMKLEQRTIEFRKQNKYPTEEDMEILDEMSTKIFEQIDKEVQAEVRAAEKKQELIEKEKEKERELAEEKKRLLEQQQQEEQARYESRINTAMNFAERMGSIIGKQAASGKMTAEEFNKALVKIGFDAMRQILYQSIFQITARELGTKSFAGIATAAVLTGILEVAFSAMEAKMQFASGRYPVVGPMDGKTYDAQMVGVPKTGIYSQPSLGLFSESMPEMVIDGPTTRNLQVNYPGVIDSIMAARQFAAGDYTPAANPQQSNQIQQAQEVQQQNTALMEAIQRLNSNIEKGISARFGYDTTRDIRDRITEIEDIERSVG